MKAALSITAAWVLFAAAPLAAQSQQRSLSLLDAVQRALAAHPSIELAAANVARARSGVREARAAQLPTLGLDGSLSEFQEPMVVAPLHGFDARNPPSFDRTLSQGSLNLGYTLFDAARGSRIDRAEALQEAAQSSALAARMQLLSDVARAYLRVRTAREVAQAHERRVSALTQERGRTRQLVEQGRAARVVQLRAEAALSAAQAEGVSAASDVEIAENELARQLGVPVDSVHTAALTTSARAAVAVPPVEQYREAARVSNPDLLRAQRQIAAAQATRGEAHGLWLPRFQVGGRYVEYGSTKSAPQGEWQGAVQLSYPLFTGGARAAANDRAAAEVRAAEAEYQLAERRVADAIDRAYAAWRAARARVQALEAAVAQSDEVTRI
ncbi:MAG TPA: TolC family protein, partial [Longimicrobiales bacterium]